MGKFIFIIAGVITMGLITSLLMARSASFGGKAEGKRLERMKANPQYKDGAFVNIEATPHTGESNLLQTAGEWITGDQVREPDVPLPVHKLSTEMLRARGDQGLRVTWMGHSSMLVELDGHLILTDPVWGQRTSPFPGVFGPSRFHEVPIEIEDLPKLDAILISHDHYDHLDYPSILRLVDRDVPFLVPLGIGAHLEAWGVPADRIIEHHWWQETKVGNLTLVSTPAQHFSGRGLRDRNHTLWTSWAMLGPHHRVWFSGDTGPFTQFNEIGEKFGPFDATMIEIGAWDANWSSIHLGPEAATTVHEQVKGKVMIPVHWGTFNLALHDWDQPIVALQEFAKAKNITLGVPTVGNQVEVENPQVDPFWVKRASIWEGKRVLEEAHRPDMVPQAG